MRWIAGFLGRFPRLVTALILAALAASVWGATDYVETVVRPREAEARQARIAEEVARADSLFDRGKMAEALGEYTYVFEAFAADLAPAALAGVHERLGLCHVHLAEDGEAGSNLEGAVAEFELALALRPPAADPAGHAATWYLIGDAWRALAAAAGDAAPLDRAADAYQAGLAVLAPEADTDAYVAGFRALGNVERDLYAADPDRHPIDAAMARYEEALRLANPLDHPRAHADTLIEIGRAYVLLSERGYVERNLDRAIETYLQAVKVYDVEHFPREHAFVHKLLGDAYTRVTMTEPKSRTQRAAHQQRVIRAQNRAKTSYQIARSFGLEPEFGVAIAPGTAPEANGAATEADKTE